MDRETALAKLRAMDDTEDHEEADAVLCQLLVSLGYADVVAEWERLPKWYD